MRLSLFKHTLSFFEQQVSGLTLTYCTTAACAESELRHSSKMFVFSQPIPGVPYVILHIYMIYKTMSPGHAVDLACMHDLLRLHNKFWL